MLSIDRCQSCVHYVDMKNHPRLYSGADDGMCTKAGRANPAQWVVVTPESKCDDYISKGGAAVLEKAKRQIPDAEFKQMAQQITEQSVKPPPSDSHVCVDCEYYRQLDQTNQGECAKHNNAVVNQAGGCMDYMQCIDRTKRPQKITMSVGDRVRVLPECDGTLVFASAEIAIIKGDDGKERPYDVTRCRFTKL